MGWLDRLFRQGAVDGERDLSSQMERAFEAAGRGDHEAAVAIWRPLAEKGVARAQTNLGACHSEGLGVPRDLAAAARLFEAAANAGDAVGRRNLATFHFRGDGGLPQDDGKAAELYRLAASQGDAAAQDMLSWMLLEDGERRDPAEARRWALAAAGQGVATSMTRLGMIAHDALGTERDPAEAARWWREAALRGEADGQAMLGAALHLGAGVAKDDRKALVWLLRGEAKGSALATPFIGAVRAALSAEAQDEAEAEAAGPPGEEQAA